MNEHIMCRFYTVRHQHNLQRQNIVGARSSNFKHFNLFLNKQ